MKVIFLDSGPLTLITQRAGVRAADDCREWAATHLANGNRVVVPEIVDYEARRELLRAGKTAAIQRLDRLNSDPLMTYLPLDTAAMRLAARLWGDIRNRGLPTAPDDDIDIDVILAAQALGSGHAPADCVIATTNLGHISRFLAADLWQNI